MWGGFHGDCKSAITGMTVSLGRIMGWLRKVVETHVGLQGKNFDACNDATGLSGVPIELFGHDFGTQCRRLVFSLITRSRRHTRI